VVVAVVILEPLEPLVLAEELPQYPKKVEEGTAEIRQAQQRQAERILAVVVVVLLWPAEEPLAVLEL
jgi:hypothetical protein